MPRVCLDPAVRAEIRFSDWVRRELKEQDKSQKDLGDLLGVTQADISKLINGKVKWKLQEAVKTVLYLGGDIAYIFGF